MVFFLRLLSGNLKTSIDISSSHIPREHHTPHCNVCSALHPPPPCAILLVVSDLCGLACVLVLSAPCCMAVHACRRRTPPRREKLFLKPLSFGGTKRHLPLVSRIGEGTS
jgi:hypothetical protein